MSTAAGMQTAAAQPEVNELLQSLAHELRQPLGAIDSISYYLDLVLPRDDGRAREQSSRLHALVQQCSWILSCALEMAEERPIAPQLLSLEELLTQALGAMRGANAEPNFKLDLAGELPLIQLDPQRGYRMVEHLTALFLPLSSDTYPAHARTRTLEGSVVLEMTVATPGHSSEAALCAGSTMAVASIRRAAEAHKGSFAFQVDANTGVRGRLLLPASSD